MILELIRELAQFERLEDQVTATVPLLEASLFGARPAAEVLIAEGEAEVIGFALFFHNYSTFLGKPGIYLEDLYVRPQERSRGTGRALLARIAAIAQDRSCGRLEWSVLDWNERALRFYRSLGAVPMDEWTVQRLTGTALDALANPARTP